MKLSREYRALFALVKAGLWHERIEDTTVFPLTDEEWDNVVELAHRQTVTGLVYRGLDYLHDSCLPPDNVMFPLVADADRIENLNKRINNTVVELFGIFEERGLHPVLQKGQGGATMYLDPLLREPGDIDIYFPNEAEHRIAQEIVLEHVASVSKMSDGAICYKWKGIEVEHHRSMYDIHSPFAINRLKKFFDIADTKKIYLDKALTKTICVPPAKQNLLLMVSHILKHAIGRGVGLRQLCDLARACHELRTEVDAPGMRCLYEVAGIGKWSKMLHEFLCEWVGMPKNDSPYNGTIGRSDTSKLFEIIVRGGNFGHYDERLSKVPSSMWRRRLQTFNSFCSNASFSLSVAWQEAVWTVARLGVRG